jgi:hypothetical protein
MRHLTPSLSSHISLYTFLPSSPTACILHVASNVALNPGLERPCRLCRHYQTIFPKPKKIALKIWNVGLTNTHVGMNVALNPSLERACILLQGKRDKFLNIGNLLLRYCFCSKSRQLRAILGTRSSSFPNHAVAILRQDAAVDGAIVKNGAYALPTLS